MNDIVFWVFGVLFSILALAFAVGLLSFALLGLSSAWQYFDGVRKGLYMSDLKWIRESRGVSVAAMANELSLSPDEYQAFEDGSGQSRLDRIPGDYKKQLVASAADVLKERKSHG